MSQSLFLALAMWGMTFYVLRHTRKIEATNRILQGLPSPAPASWICKILYVVIGLSVASAVFVGSALADGADPFGHVQNVIRSVVQTEAPESVKPTVVYLPTPTSVPTPTNIPTFTPIPIPTPTLNAVLPSPAPLPQTPNDDDKTPGWQKTPNGQGQGQFQTPPGQIDKPTKEPNQPKPTQEPKPTKDNNGNGSSKK